MTIDSGGSAPTKRAFRHLRSPGQFLKFEFFIQLRGRSSISGFLLSKKAEKPDWIEKNQIVRGKEKGCKNRPAETRKKVGQKKSVKNAAKVRPFRRNSPKMVIFFTNSSILPPKTYFLE